MTKYYCDLCGEEIKNRSDNRLYNLPIATEEDRVMRLDGLLLCKKCERNLYNAIVNVTSKDCLVRLKQLATCVYEDSEW